MIASKEIAPRKNLFGKRHNERLGFLLQQVYRKNALATVPEEYMQPEISAADFSFDNLFLGDIVMTRENDLYRRSVSFMVTDVPPYEWLTEGRVLVRPIRMTFEDDQPYGLFDRNLYGSLTHELSEDKPIGGHRALFMNPVPLREGVGYSFPFDTFRLTRVLPDEEAVRLSELYKEQHKKFRDAAIVSGTATAFGAVVFSSLVASGGSGGLELTAAATATGALAYGKRTIEALQRENEALRAGVVKCLSEGSLPLGELLRAQSKYIFFSPY